MKRSNKRQIRKALPVVRSRKAGRPVPESVAPPRVRRRQKTAHAAVWKDTMLLQASDGPRVWWGVTKPKIKKR